GIDVGRRFLGDGQPRRELDDARAAGPEVVHSAQLEHAHTDQQLVAGLEGSWPLELVVVDERAVGRLEVLDGGGAVGRGCDPSVLPGDLTVGEDEIGVRIAADDDRAIDDQLLARVWPLDDFQIDLARHGRGGYEIRATRVKRG